MYDRYTIYMCENSTVRLASVRIAQAHHNNIILVMCVPRYHVRIDTRLSSSFSIFRRGEGRAWERGYWGPLSAVGMGTIISCQDGNHYQLSGWGPLSRAQNADRWLTGKHLERSFSPCSCPLKIIATHVL